jgi:hypothetical protein
MFMLSFLEIPVGVRKRLDFYRSSFFWQTDETKKKYRLTKWSMVCRPKEQGGLGIEVLELKNKCLLSKWLFKLLTEEGMWQQILSNKYLKNQTLAQVEEKPTDSPFWKGLMRVKSDFFARGYFKVGDGSSVRFWEDVWLGDTSLALRYPSLYNIVQRKNVLVSTVLAQAPLNITFRRTLNEHKWNLWITLCQQLMGVQLTNSPDNFVWRLNDSGIFTVKSMYLDLMNGHSIGLRKNLWKLKIPLKIKIFMWFLNNKVLLTKDNLAKRNWNGCQKCCFCNELETIHHLFLACPFAKIVWRMVYLTFNLPPPANITNMFGNWLNGVKKLDKARIRIGISAICWPIWTSRNDIIFDKQKGTNFLQVIRRAAYWIQQWALLLPEDQRETMVTGCNRLLTVTQDFFFLATGWRHTSRLQNG